MIDPNELEYPPLLGVYSLSSFPEIRIGIRSIDLRGWPGSIYGLEIRFGHWYPPPGILKATMGKQRLDRMVHRRSPWFIIGRIGRLFASRAVFDLPYCFRTRSSPVEAFRVLRAIRFLFGKRAFGWLNNRLTELSWPMILTAHGFSVSMATYDRTQIWSRLRHLEKHFSAHGFSLFLTSGALLGMYREHALLKFDDDIDLIAINPRMSMSETARFFSELPRTFGEISWIDSPEVAHRTLALGDGLPNVDLFPGWRLDPENLFIYPAGPMKASDFLPERFIVDGDYRLRIPAQPEKLLELLYGDWQVPEQAFKFNWRKQIRRSHIRQFIEALEHWHPTLRE